MARKKEPKCMTPGCNGKALNRGLCSGCYQAARRAIRAGGDEQKMIDAGLIRPSKSGQRSPWTEAAEAAGVVQ